MKTKAFLEQFEKLERLIERLPEGLQKPILREIVPLKELFLRQRPPRLALSGDSTVDASALFSALFGAHLPPEATQSRGWQEFSRGGRGTIRVLDARPSGPLGALNDAARVAASAESPDLVLHLRGVSSGESGESGDFDGLEVLMQFVTDRHEQRPALVGVAVAGVDENPEPVQLEAARIGLAALLSNRPEFGGHLAPTLAIATAVRFRPDGSLDELSDRRQNVEALANLLVSELPNEAKLDMARMSGAREGQATIARSLVKSVTAACGAIGTQPIPLADLPILLTLQIMMVSGILYISGREASFRLGAQFLAALGLNFGAGFAFRELARSLAKFLPGWGNAISGVVAAGGTYALGRSATAYFIEGVSIGEARKMFRRQRREKAALLPQGEPRR
jgi:uncharacterized protein (DUF697 family)